MLQVVKFTVLYLFVEWNHFFESLMPFHTNSVTSSSGATDVRGWKRSSNLLSLIVFYGFTSPNGQRMIIIIEPRVKTGHCMSCNNWNQIRDRRFVQKNYRQLAYHKRNRLFEKSYNFCTVNYKRALFWYVWYNCKHGYVSDVERW